MLIKMIGIILVLISGGFICRRIKFTNKEKKEELEEFLKVISSIHTDIGYKKMTISDCLENSEQKNNNVRAYIDNFNAALKSGDTAEEACKIAFEESELFINEESRNIIKNFFSSLGQTPYEVQLNDSLCCIEKLTVCLAETEQNKKRNEKAQCSLAFGISLAIIIILC